MTAAVPRGYLTHLKTVAREAMATTFDDDYPITDFQSLLVSIEFPNKAEAYPSIWVDFTPTGDLQNAGIGHFEEGHPHGEGGDPKRFQRWRFAGTLSYTGVALTSLECDMLFDEIVNVLAFGLEATPTSEFRTYLENNEFIAVNGNFDEIGQSGFAATPGTPWGTEDVIYERTASLACWGEFVSDGVGNLALLSEVALYPYSDREADPTTSGGWQ